MLDSEKGLINMKYEEKIDLYCKLHVKWGLNVVCISLDVGFSVEQKARVLNKDA